MHPVIGVSQGSEPPGGTPLWASGCWQEARALPLLPSQQLTREGTKGPRSEFPAQGEPVVIVMAMVPLATVTKRPRPAPGGRVLGGQAGQRGEDTGVASCKEQPHLHRGHR